MDDLLENNKLIAEFFGLKYDKPSKFKVLDGNIPIKGYYEANDESIFILNEYYEGVVEENSMLFHKSYDWLMPVVEKISSINDNVFWIIIGGDNEVGFNNNTGVRNDIEYNGIESIYQKVVEFIKWYNENNKK